MGMRAVVGLLRRALSNPMPSRRGIITSDCGRRGVSVGRPRKVSKRQTHDDEGRRSGDAVFEGGLTILELHHVERWKVMRVSNARPHRASLCELTFAEQIANVLPQVGIVVHEQNG